MPDDNQPGTLEDVLNLQPGSKEKPAWVNITFEALVSVGQAVATRNGGKRYPVTLTDPDDARVRVTISVFDGKFVAFHGKRVRFGGKGMSRGEYNGAPEISFGKNVTMDVLGSVGSSPPTQQRREENRPPVSAKDAPAPSTPPKASDAGFEAKAIEHALRLIETHLLELEIGSEAFSKQVYTIASDLVRVYDRLTKRQLAKGPAERAGKTAPAATPPPEEQGGRSDPPPRPPDDDDPDKDVPF